MPSTYKRLWTIGASTFGPYIKKNRQFDRRTHEK
jgi:hypothetical protein